MVLRPPQKTEGFSDKGTILFERKLILIEMIKLLIKNQLLYTLAESMAVETDELKRQMQALREHTSCIVASLVHAFGVGIVQEALKDKSHWFQDRDPEDLDCF